MPDRCQIVLIDDEPEGEHPDLAARQARIASIRAAWRRAHLGPAPLPIDGHAYRARRRNRTRRNR